MAGERDHGGFISSFSLFVPVVSRTWCIYLYVRMGMEYIDSENWTPVMDFLSSCIVNCRDVVSIYIGGRAE
jgi:hypothetical protein